MKRSIGQSRAERNIEINLAAADERQTAIHVKGILGLTASAEHLMPNRAPVFAAFEAIVKQAGLTPDQAASLQLAATARIPPFMDALTRQAGLSVEEAGSLNFELNAQWHNTSQTIAYIDDLTPGARVNFDNAIRGVYSGDPVVHLWYESWKSNLDADTVRYIDNLLAQPDSTPH